MLSRALVLAAILSGCAAEVTSDPPSEPSCEESCLDYYDACGDALREGAAEIGCASSCEALPLAGECYECLNEAAFCSDGSPDEPCQDVCERPESR